MKSTVLRTILSFAATAMAAQIATGIHLQDVRFTGDTRLEGVDLKKCASDLKSHVYAGTDWNDDLIRVVQTQCLLDTEGYLKAVVKDSIQQLPDKKALINLPSRSIFTQVRDTVWVSSRSRGLV